MVVIGTGDLMNLFFFTVEGLENISLFSYLYAELTRGYLLEHDEAKFTEKRERVQTFMKIPMELEKVNTRIGKFMCTFLKSNRLFLKLIEENYPYLSPFDTPWGCILYGKNV